MLLWWCPSARSGAREGAGRHILIPTCSWILLLKYFWISLRLVLEQRARWLSRDCGEDERGWSGTRTRLQPGDAAPPGSHTLRKSHSPHSPAPIPRRLRCAGSPGAARSPRRGSTAPGSGEEDAVSWSPGTHPGGLPLMSPVPSGHTAASCSAGSRMSAAPQLQSARPRCDARGEQGGCEGKGKGL